MKTTNPANVIRTSTLYTANGSVRSSKTWVGTIPQISRVFQEWYHVNFHHGDRLELSDKPRTGHLYELGVDARNFGACHRCGSQFMSQRDRAVEHPGFPFVLYCERCAELVTVDANAA